MRRGAVTARRELDWAQADVRSQCQLSVPCSPSPPMSNGDRGLPGRISIHWLRALMLGWRLGCAVRWTSWLLMDELLRSDKSTEHLLAETTRPCPRCFVPIRRPGGACTCRVAISAVSTNSAGHRSQRRSPRGGPVKRTVGLSSICFPGQMRTFSFIFVVSRREPEYSFSSLRKRGRQVRRESLSRICCWEPCSTPWCVKSWSQARVSLTMTCATTLTAC